MRLLLCRSLGAAFLAAALLGLVGLSSDPDARDEAVVGGETGAAQEAAPDPVALLVQQLGAASYVKREEAGKELKALGEKALPALLDAAAASKDPEVHLRASALAHTIMLDCRNGKVSGLQMAVIKADEFTMGSPAAEPGRRADEAEHPVRIARSFFLGVYELTQAQYRRVMKANPSWFAPTGQGKDIVAGHNTEAFPVESVSWYDAIEFCNGLSELDGYKPYYTLTGVQRQRGAIRRATVKIAGGNGYRLPTEAEWEYACRAGTTTAFYYGKDTKANMANLKPVIISGGYGSTLKWPDLKRTAMTGNYAPNPWGLHDMHGNVAEWCWDWYSGNYYGRSPKADPAGPEHGTHRVIRGGSWLVNEWSARSANRFFHLPTDSHFNIGFRVARSG
jgi:formylglycine-generating enzyme required for sulfatase activity